MRERLSFGWLLLVVLAFCLPLFVGLGASDLGNDEAIYSYAVESILDTGDWLSPRSSPNRHIVFLEKPPLKFWIVAAPIHWGVLPRSEFGLRFWDAVFGSVAFVYVFFIGHRIAGALCGAFAVLVLFAHTPLLFEHGLRSNNMEAALLLAYCGGMSHYLAWTTSDTTRRGVPHVAAVAAFFFLGFMTKFVAALFLPLVLGVVTLLVTPYRRLLWRDLRVWITAAVAFVSAVLPWFIYQYVQEGGHLWEVMFGEHVYTRFTAFADPSHLQPWHFYFSQIYEELMRSGSAAAVLLGLLVLLVSVVRDRRPEGVLLFVWAFVPLSLISFGTSKIYHYAYPFLPPLALAAGYLAWWLWQQVLRVTATASARLPGGLRRFTADRRVRAVAIVLFAVGIAVSVATAIEGAVRVDVAGTTILRNSSVSRPLVIAVGAVAVLGGIRAALAGGLLLLLAAAVPAPLTAYATNLEALRAGRRPLRNLATCISDVHASQRARGLEPPGVYAPVSHEAFNHPYYYYLRGSGWHRPLDDETVREALLDPARARVVVTDASRYREFLARTAEVAPAVPVLRVDQIVIVLPGEFAACAATMKDQGPSHDGSR